jgi:hypothetical protein
VPAGTTLPPCAICWRMTLPGTCPGDPGRRPAAVQLADGQLERDGQLRTWQTVGVFRIAGGKIAECWLVPFDQYLFDELWS